FLLTHTPPSTTLFPYTTLFRSTGPEKLTLFKSNMLFSDLNFFFDGGLAWDSNTTVKFKKNIEQIGWQTIDNEGNQVPVYEDIHRSEEHTSELQSRENLVCRLLL